MRRTEKPAREIDDVEQSTTAYVPKMSTWMITFVTFVAVCGTGPFTSEILVKVGYPFIGIVGLMIMPWFVGAPSALTTAELSSMLPDNRGYLLWVQKAFGSFWGFQQGVLQAICGIVDLAIYPVLFSEYLAELIPMDHFSLKIVQAFFVLLGVGVDVLGVTWIGNLSILISAIVLFPFLLIVIIGFPSVTPSKWFQLPEGSLFSLDWGLYINIMAFKFTGFDTMSHFAGDMKHPSSFFIAMGGALSLAIVARVLPMLVAVCVVTDYSLYDEGYYTVIADKVGGVVLSSLVVVSAAVGCWVTYVTYLYSSSVTLYTLGGRDYLDSSFLNVMGRYDTPWVCIIAVATSSFFFGVLSFEELVKLSGSLYQICVLMQYASLVKLRISKPKVNRPNKIPLSTPALMIYLIPPTLISLFILTSAIRHSLSAALVLLSSVTCSVSLYFVKNWVHRRRAVHFQIE